MVTDVSQILSEAIADFLTLSAFEPSEEAIRFHQVVSSVHRICAALQMQEQRGVARQELLGQVDEVRRRHAQSPLIHRLQRWPRGYQGDFETIEWLCDASNRAPYGTIGYLLEQYILIGPASQQHRNKVQQQGNLVAETFRQHQDDSERVPRALLIASGGCRDLLMVTEELLRMRGEIVLVDIDAGAIELARERLRAFGDRCQFYEGNVFRMLRKLPGRFDLILAGGLFDYLEDKHVAWLLRTCVEHVLDPKGTIFFTNMATGNPYRVWMEYMADWRLKERSEDGMRRFLLQTGFSDASFTFTRDLTGLALLATIRAPQLNPVVAEQSDSVKLLRCPNCVEFDMAVQQVRGVTIDVCPMCSGCWLDHGELETLLLSQPASSVPLVGSEAGTRNCPRCVATMDVGTHPALSSVEIDHCTRCDGLWFDRGEMARVMEVLSVQSD